jgi:hypothetical protein
MSTTSTFTQLSPDDQKRLLDKLAKLKALSECRTGNVNETATAAATMTRIMLEYQIEIADLEGALGLAQPDGVVDEPVFSQDSYRGFPTWKTTMLSAIAKTNHCRCYFSSEQEYVLWTQRTRSRMSLIGTAQDVENTRRLLFFCIDEVERLCAGWGRGESVKRKNDFKRGAGSGIANKILEEHRRVLEQERRRAAAQQQASAALALFDRKRQAVNAYAEELGLVSRSRRNQRVHPDAYQAGYHAGSSLDFNAGVRAALPAARN